MKYKIKRGDEVVVIAGAHKGQRGKVLEVLREQERVVIEGVNMVKRHRKATKENDPDAGIVEREGSVHYSNVMKADRYDSRKSA
ncbi:50S ribosomal protein L24 [Ruficoccus amylovorans]|uniref:Large ribosomal subunit protein uL24 n=1 Tax=Ruficoccus amylovorans TaxID=1804625 RepID=A0A842HA77_9BACT|nr:50S ribosomal protein L24 [Ruficoccus amylovorans]MBC2593312.1 50S ribosomal protein L24 [Ruficoccus amylovorans]